MRDCEKAISSRDVEQVEVERMLEPLDGQNSDFGEDENAIVLVLVVLRISSRHRNRFG